MVLDTIAEHIGTAIALQHPAQLVIGVAITPPVGIRPITPGGLQHAVHSCSVFNIVWIHTDCGLYICHCVVIPALAQREHPA